MRRFRCLMMKDKRDRSPLCRNYELENMKTKREDLEKNKKKYQDTKMKRGAIPYNRMYQIMRVIYVLT